MTIRRSANGACSRSSAGSRCRGSGETGGRGRFLPVQWCLRIVNQRLNTRDAAMAEQDGSAAGLPRVPAGAGSRVARRCGRGGGDGRAGVARAVIGAGRPRRRPDGFGRAKSCILIFMWGGPSQLDTWDPKPDAPGGDPRRVRHDRDERCRASGSASTSRCSPQRAHRLAIVRSMSHDDFAHLSTAHRRLDRSSRPDAPFRRRRPVAAATGRTWGRWWPEVRPTRGARRRAR